MEIVENSVDLLGEFILLNEEWIKRYFEIEETDRNLAKNPMSIIDSGGFIFSLIYEGDVKGVCALFNEGNGVYELARMAVSPESQCKGYGKKLIEAALEKLSEIQAEKVYLVSNTKLESAINLYKRYGFSVVSEGPHPIYSRANIVMEKGVESTL